MDQDRGSTKSSPPNASANTTSNHSKLRSIVQNDSKRKAERDADHQPIEFIHSIKNGRTNNNKLFKLINTDEKTVKQNNFYFTKQQKKLQQMKPEKSSNDINLPENIINDENLSETSSSSPPMTKLKTEDIAKNLSSPISSKKVDKMHTKIRWRPVSSPKHESSSLAVLLPPQPAQATQFESDHSPFSSQMVENDASSKTNNVGITYILSPIPSNSSTNVADLGVSKNGKLEQQQQIMPIVESNQDQQPQRIHFPPFAPFPPFYGAPYGTIPFPPPFPPELSTHAIPQNQIGQRPLDYPPYPPDFQPLLGMYAPPQMMIPPPASNMAQDETPISQRDETPLYETTPSFDNASLDGSKSSRGRSRLSSSFIPPMPIFPPPPPARLGSNGPNLIPHYPPNPNLEKANLLSLLNASSNSPEIDVDFYKAVSSLDYLLNLKRKLEKNANLGNDQNGIDEDNDNDNNNDNNNDKDCNDNDINNNENAEQDSETEEELAFMDRKMEKYYFLEGNDLENYYNQIKYKRVAPYIVNKVTVEEDEKFLERSSDLQFKDLGISRRSLDNGIDQLKKSGKRKFDALEDYELLNETFNKNLERNFQLRRAQLLRKIEDVQKGKDDAFNLETVELEEKRDFELLRLKNFRDFERNENLRLYFDDSLTIYQDFTQLIIQKLSNVKNFLTYQREILGNDLDKELLDISSLKSGRFIKSFGSKNSNSSDDNNNNKKDHEIPKPAKDVVTTIQTSTETSSSDTDLTTSNTSAPLLSLKLKKFGKLKRPQPPALKNSKKKPVQQYQLDDYTPLLSSAEFDFITDTSTNFYSKIVKYFENTKTTSTQQQLLMMSPNTRSTKSSKRSSSPSSKKLSNLAKSIRDSNGFSGGLVNANDYSLQLQKVMKLYTAPSKLNDDEILTDLKMMGKDVDKWIL